MSPAASPQGPTPPRPLPDLNCGRAAEESSVGHMGSGTWGKGRCWPRWPLAHRLLAILGYLPGEEISPGTGMMDVGTLEDSLEELSRFK